MFASNGLRPYEEAVIDAIAADTRKGELSERGRRYEEAMKADLRDDTIRHAIVRELWTSEVQSEVDVARAKYVEIRTETTRLAALYEPRGVTVRFIDVLAAQKETGRVDYDLTQLLMVGQNGGKVAIALNYSFKDEPQLTVAGDHNWDFVSLFGLPGGMPNRVTIAPERLGEAIDKISAY